MARKNVKGNVIAQITLRLYDGSKREKRIATAIRRLDKGLQRDVIIGALDMGLALLTKKGVPLDYPVNVLESRKRAKKPEHVEKALKSENSQNMKKRPDRATLPRPDFLGPRRNSPSIPDYVHVKPEIASSDDCIECREPGMSDEDWALKQKIRCELDLVVSPKIGPAKQKSALQQILEDD